MIRLRRPAQPRVLLQKAAAATAELQTAWNNGQPLDIKDSLYGHAEVKAALRTAQHDKCAYCETRDVRSPGAVEHYRPKGGWQQSASEPLQQPGYFWLAYEWENLLFACTMCNDAGHKGNHFPLANPAARATPAQPNHRRERPLLLNPYEADPARHIAWSAHIPRARGNSRCGKQTIKSFGLDQNRLLIDDRRDTLQSVTFVLSLAEDKALASTERAAIRSVLLAYLDGSKEHTTMIEASLGKRIRAL